MLHPAALFKELLSSIQTLGVWGYWLLGLMSFFESVAFIGWFVPGGLFVISAGFFAANGVFDVEDIIVFAAAGTIIGEALSYYFGKQGTKFFKYENKILKLSHLEKGQKFFQRYGVKSIFIARFIGPLRPIIPFIAGLTGISTKDFFIWNVPSGILWAILFTYLGYFFGNIWTTVHPFNNKLVLISIAVVVFTILALFTRKKLTKTE